MSTAPACSTIRLTRCPTTSCISRVIRARSASTASRARSFCSVSARSARSRSAVMSSARVRTQSAKTAGRTSSTITLRKWLSVSVPDVKPHGSRATRAAAPSTAQRVRPVGPYRTTAYAATGSAGDVPRATMPSSTAAASSQTGNRRRNSAPIVASAAVPNIAAARASLGAGSGTVMSAMLTSRTASATAPSSANDRLRMGRA
jgi:hypothetical protein